MTVPLLISFRVIFCSFVRLERFLWECSIFGLPLLIEKVEAIPIKNQRSEAWSAFGLAFPAGGTCFPCTLHSHTEASSSSLRGPSSPEWASIRESSEEWFSSVLHSIVKRSQCHSDSMSWGSLQSGSGREPEVHSCSWKKEKKKPTKRDRSTPSLLIHIAAVTLSLQRDVLFPVWLKISKFRFIMTGADKFAGEMQAVSLSC